ncbi:MAG: acylphosphatase [Gemmatimonadaceae bacterium]
MTHLHVRITGIVQGVGFRWFVRERARRLGVSGWVRNLPDGSVEVAASGEPGQLELLRNELRRGPNGARVDGVDDVDDHAEEPMKTPFGVLR